MSKILTREICRSYVEGFLFEPNNISKPKVRQIELGCVGIELEIFPYMLDLLSSKGVKPVPLTEREESLVNVLVHVSKQYGGVVKIWNPDAHLIGYIAQVEQIIFPDGDRFLFEPGGQIEISTAPCNSIEELQSHLSAKQNILKLVTQQSNIHFAQFGTNPWFDVNEIGNQIHKPRYNALEKYFEKISPYGKQMMLQTGSLHINLDLGSDQSMRVKRVVAANLLVPFTTAIFANSPIIEGEIVGHMSFRSFLWQHLDIRRTGILPMNNISKTLTKDTLIDAYLDFALKAPLIYISELGEQVLPNHYTLEYWLENPIEGLWPDEYYLANHLSLLFPECRLKGYIEIRSVDAPPMDWQLIPVMFYIGLLYSNVHLDQVMEILLPLSSRINVLHADATYGLLSDEIFAVSKKLMLLAIDGFSGLPTDFKSEQHKQQLINFFETFTLQRKTFADLNLERFALDNTLVS